MTFVPAPPSEPLRPLDLAQRKDIGALITSSWRIWKARPGVFLLTAMTVGFVPLAAYRIISVLVVSDVAKRFSDTVNSNVADHATDPFYGFDWNSLIVPGIVAFVGGVIVSLLVPALVTATHARAVTALATGDDLSGTDALERGFAVLGPAAWSIFVYGALTFLATLLLILPGVYVGVAGMFTTIIVALGVGRGFGALRESIRVVRAAGWWRTLGTSFVIYLVAYAIAFIPLAVIGAITSSAGTSDGVKIVGAVIEGLIQTALLSWSALALTLFFFSTKARIGETWQAPAGTKPVDIPGGGGDAPAQPAYPVTGPYYGSSPTPGAPPPYGSQPTPGGPPPYGSQPTPGGPTFVRPGQVPPTPPAPGAPRFVPPSAPPTTSEAPSPPPSDDEPGPPPS